MEEALDKLGTVLAVTNEINRDAFTRIDDALKLLSEQQKRQKEIILVSMGLAAVICLSAIAFAFHSLNTLSEQVRQNTEVLRYVTGTQAGERLP